MLATHTINPEDPASSAGQALYTISAGGFSATADAFARDEKTDGLWFVSMVGSQTALKAIWASLLKQPPDSAHIIKGADGMAFSGGYQRCVVPYETVGSWTTKIARLPVSGGWHALVYTKQAEFGFEKDSFLLLAQSEEDAPDLHHRFLDKRSPLPLHGSWAGWLWERGIGNGEIVPLQSVGVSAFRCSPKAKELREELSDAVASSQAHAAQGGVRWIGRSRGPSATTSGAASATTGHGSAFRTRREVLPILPPRRITAPVPVGTAPLLPAGDGGGTEGSLGHALSAHAAGWRFDAGAADDRSQPRRVDNRLLRPHVQRALGPGKSSATSATWQ